LNFYGEHLTKEDSEGFYNLKKKTNLTLKYADNIVLLDKEEMAEQDMTDRLTEVGRWSGMEMNKIKKLSNATLRVTSPIHIMIDQKQLEDVA
jgi:hypothetical protein